MREARPKELESAGTGWEERSDWSVLVLGTWLMEPDIGHG